MKLIHTLLLLLFIGRARSKPLDDDDLGNPDNSAKSDIPGNAESGDNKGNTDNAGNADNADKASNADNPVRRPSRVEKRSSTEELLRAEMQGLRSELPLEYLVAPGGDDDKKEKEKDKAGGELGDQAAITGDSPPIPSDNPTPDSPADAPASAGEKKPDDALPEATPTPTGKTPTGKTPTGKTPSPSKAPTSKSTNAVEKSDKVADDTPTTSIPSTNKPTNKVTSPSPKSSTSHPKSTVQPTIIKKASIPSSPKPTTAAPTKAKTTAAPTQPTTAAPTHHPTKATTMKPPPAPPSDADARSKVYRADKYGQTVEKSDNNTLKMNGTTFRIAVRLLEEKFTEDLNYQKNPVFQNLKKTVMSAVAIVYDGYHDFKQIAIIGFTETPTNDSDADKRDSIGGNSVIADFYLRFFSFGRHLKKLTDAIKNEKIGSLTVSPKFVKAYVAEPKGRVCTPDCKLKCYSYCDDGCCILRFQHSDESPHVDERHVEIPHIKWSGAPISPHSQPIDESDVCHGSRCLSRGMSPLRNDDLMLEKSLSQMQPRTMGCHGSDCFSSTPEGAAAGVHPFLSNHCNGDKLCEDILSQATSRSEIARSFESPNARDTELDKISELMGNPPSDESLGNMHTRSGMSSALPEDGNSLSYFGMDGSVPGERSLIPQDKSIGLHRSMDLMGPDEGSCQACAHHCLPTCLNGCCNPNERQHSSLSSWAAKTPAFDKGTQLW